MDNFLFNLYSFIYQIIDFIVLNIEKTDYSNFTKAIYEYFVALIATVGLLAVYRLQFLENAIKENRELLVKYASILKERHQGEEFNVDWYSYMDDAELSNFINTEVIPKHKKDYKDNKDMFNELRKDYGSRWGQLQHTKSILIELDKMLLIINSKEYSQKAYKELSFNLPSPDEHKFKRCLHDIRVSRMRVDTFQKRMASWTKTRENCDHFRETSRKFLFALIFCFVYFFILYLLPDYSRASFKYIIWLSGAMILGYSLYFLKKFIFICLEKINIPYYDGISP